MFGTNIQGRVGEDVVREPCRRTRMKSRDGMAVDNNRVRVCEAVLGFLPTTWSSTTTKTKTRTRTRTRMMTGGGPSQCYHTMDRLGYVSQLLSSSLWSPDSFSLRLFPRLLRHGDSGRGRTSHLVSSSLSRCLKQFLSWATSNLAFVLAVSLP
ncbi:hypothetical protein LZ30DRAFT_429352 [Colletotrichum cereale]|nr:hypothetical protein LZ30DRAFT_429352 [Colletotrichum cereale]